MSSEMVEMLCEQMDFKTLSRYMRTSFKNKEICGKVFEKRKKEDIQRLIRVYPFSHKRSPFSAEVFQAEDFQAIFDEIIKRAEQDNELYKIKYLDKQTYEEYATLKHIPISDVYFQGNIYRGFLAAQKYLWDMSLYDNYNLFNVIMNKAIEEYIADEDDNLILWAEEKVVETENIELDFIFKNPKFFEYIVDGLAESHLQYSNPGLIEVSMENPQIL